MNRELDALDVQLLRALLTDGELNPQEIHIQRRLDRLEMEGFVKSHRVERQNDFLTFGLTEKGQTAIKSRYSAQ